LPSYFHLLDLLVLISQIALLPFAPMHLTRTVRNGHNQS
jgi:hypothetical protein